MIGDKLTAGLLDDINNLNDPENTKSNDEENREEKKTMATNLKDLAKNNKNKATETQEEVTTKVEATVDEDAEKAAKAAQAAALLQQAQQESATPTTNMEETQTFVAGESMEGMSEEEIQKRLAERAEEAKKAEINAKRKLQREIDTKDYNAVIEKAQAELTSKVSEINISDEQVTYQAACRAFGRHVAFLVAEGPAPKLGLSTKFVKENGDFVPRANVSSEDIRTLQNKAKVTAEEKRDHYQFEVGVTYTYSKPKNIFGSIIEIPQILNLTLVRIIQQDFPTIDQADIEASPRILVPYSDEAFYSIVTIGFGGEITEADRMAHSKAARKNVINTLKTHINTVRVKSNGVYTGETKYNKVIISEGRKDLLVRENVIPYKIADVIRVSELNTPAGTDTKDWYNASFAKKLGAGKGTVAPLSELNENAAKILVGTLDPDTKSVTQFENKLLTGAVKFGEGAAKGITLKHWSDTKKAEDGTYVAVVEEPVLPRKVGTPKKDNITEMTYKQVYKQLGINLTLEELASMGYEAAGDLVKHKFDLQHITKLYASWATSIKQKRNASKANSSTSAKTTTRVNSLVDAETSQKLILAHLQGKYTDSKFDFDAENAKQSLISTSYIRN